MSVEKSLEIQKEFFDAVRKNVREGMTELAVLELLKKIAPNMHGDVLSGARCGLVGGDATEKRLDFGDCLILDLQVEVGGMWSDVTRTFFIGEISDEVGDAYNEVLTSLKVGEDMLKVGAIPSEIHKSTTEAIKNPYGFTHHAGHLIGCEELLPPEFLPNEQTPLKLGDFCTLEPGLYVPGKFGIRLENDYIITKEGAKNLFDYTLSVEDFVLKGH